MKVLRCFRKFNVLLNIPELLHLETFFTFIRQSVKISDRSREALGAVLQRMSFSKGYELLRAGAVCHYIYFVEQGLTRTWYIKDGKDITDWLSAENSFAVSIVSFITRQSDIRGIELLEP